MKEGLRKFSAKTFAEAMDRLDTLYFPVHIHVRGAHTAYGFEDGPIEHEDKLAARTWLDLMFDDHGDSAEAPVELPVVIWGTPHHDGHVLS